jgi:integrase/recombinase XerD
MKFSHAEKLEHFKLFLKSKWYSESTVNSYLRAMTLFLNFYKDKEINTIDNMDLIKFNNEFILERKYSRSFQNILLNAIKLFFTRVEGKKLNIDSIQRPQKEQKLPKVFSKDEVERILTVLRNLKHKAILSLIYSCGLRRSELINLKITDINSGRELIEIRGAKGKKDRFVPLSEKILVLLREYYKVYKPKYWLFEGEKEKSQYSATSIQNIFRNALGKAKINKAMTLHCLRHSYATHLLENGVDLRYIQEILGHKSSKTTEIYTHVSNKSISKIKSPFDQLNI